MSIKQKCELEANSVGTPAATSTKLAENNSTTSFSVPRYEDIAPFVGLDPHQDMNDIPTFSLHRSRIPTSLFRSIVEGIDVLLPQYGPQEYHESAETSSRFLAPIFNRLVAEFDSVFENLHGSTIEGSMATEDRVKYYFQAFGSISVIYIELEFLLADTLLGGRLDAVAHLIAECKACNQQNQHSVPIYGILSDGCHFQFFRFKGNNKRFPFSRGFLPGGPSAIPYGFELANAGASQLFIRDLRRICEIIFDFLLQSYISSLAADYDCLDSSQNQKRKQWKQALSSAHNAARKFRAAGSNHQNQPCEDTNEAVGLAMNALKHSINLIPKYGKISIMSGWDDEAMERI